MYVCAYTLVTTTIPGTLPDAFPPHQIYQNPNIHTCADPAAALSLTRSPPCFSRFSSEARMNLCVCYSAISGGRSVDFMLVMVCLKRVPLLSSYTHIVHIHIPIH